MSLTVYSVLGYEPYQVEVVNDEGELELQDAKQQRVITISSLTEESARTTVMRVYPNLVYEGIQVKVAAEQVAKINAATAETCLPCQRKAHS